MAGFLTLVTEWTIRAVVVVSLCAHVVLALFASVRRRQRSGVRTAVLWSAYQVADWAAPFVLSNLSLGSTSTEQQLVTFWLPFLLTHLGGPDNITAYSFEDNKISLRQVIGTFLRFQGITLAIYKQYKAREEQPGTLRIPSHGHGKLLDNEEALLIAHQLLHITKGAFADYSVNGDPFQSSSSSSSSSSLKNIFTPKLHDIRWKNMRKVVELELSLMYDILYTKAAMTHTWQGYLIRVVSPIATGTMTVLFLFYSKHGQRRADVIITYVLLLVTFVLEVRWLLRAIASTWAYSFFNARPGCWLHREVLYSGRWHRLRRVIVSLDPLFRKPRGSYRLWSGTIGQYNLFDECTHNTTSLCSRLVTMLASEDTWIEHKYSTRCNLVGKPYNSSESIGKLLFDQIHWTLEKAYALPLKKAEMREVEKKDDKKAWPYPPVGARVSETRYLLDKALGFVPEFQELVLILHVATEVFLVSNHQPLSESEKVHKEAIEAMSNYITFLAAARPDMLPGLNPRSLYNETREELRKVWEEESGRSSSKDNLASTLRDMEKNSRQVSRQRPKSKLHDRSFVLSEGVKIAEVLLIMLNPPYRDKNIHDLLEELSKWEDADTNSRKRFLFLVRLLIPELEKNGANQPYQIGQLFQLILKSWVRMLINVSTWCSGDSHARQLARGCELTTIVWILGQHASIFRI